MSIICIFFAENLHESKNCIIFAQENKKKNKTKSKPKKKGDPYENEETHQSRDGKD